MDIDKRIQEYNKIYDGVWNVVYNKLSDLNSYQRSQVKGNAIYYQKLRPSMDVLHKVNKHINEIKKEV